jgi:hypothetical protein
VLAIGRPGRIAHAGRPRLRVGGQRENRNQSDDNVEAGL